MIMLIDPSQVNRLEKITVDLQLPSDRLHPIQSSSISDYGITIDII